MRYPVYVPYRARQQEKFVLDTLRDNDLTFRGKTVGKFEDELRSYLGVEHVLATCNGTAAVCAAYHAAFGHPESIWRNLVAVSPMTYAATVQQLVLLGFQPLYVDCESNFQLDVNRLSDAVDKYHCHLCGVVVPSVYADAPDMADVLSEAGRYGLPVVEDAAESFGCVQDGRKVGTFGAAGAFSFFANKVITTGEGGCVATNDTELFERARHFSNLCTGRNYWHDGVGCNFRMAAMPAALGLAQLADIEPILMRKREVAAFYRATVAADPVVPAGVEESSEWMPVFRLPDGVEYERFREQCELDGIQTRPTFQPTHRMPGLGGQNPFGCPVAEGLRGFILPCYPALTDGDLDYIALCVNYALENSRDREQLRDPGDGDPMFRSGLVRGLRP